MSRKTKAFLFTKNCCGMFWTTKSIMWVRCLNPFCVDKWIINNLPLSAHTKTLYKREKVICLNARVGCLSPFMSIQIQSYSYWFYVAWILQKRVYSLIWSWLKDKICALKRKHICQWLIFMIFSKNVRISDTVQADTTILHNSIISILILLFDGHRFSIEEWLQIHYIFRRC